MLKEYVRTRKLAIKKLLIQKPTFARMASENFSKWAKSMASDLISSITASLSFESPWISLMCSKEKKEKEHFECCNNAKK